MKKTLKQLKEDRQISLDEMTALINVSETEDRNLTTDEQKSFDKVELNVEDLGTRIERLERSLKLASANVAPVSFSTQAVNKDDKDLKRFSFAEAARQAYTGNLTGIIKELDTEARHESPGQAFRGVGIPGSVLHRAATALPGAAAKAAGTDVGSFIDQLQANSVLVQAGSNFLTGLSSDRKFPIIGGINSAFVTESGYTTGTTVVPASGTIDDLTLSPNKIISLVQMSAELMQQNAAVEGALQSNMAASIMAAFEKALLQNAATTTNGPDSILSDAASDGTGAVSIASMADMEAKLLGQNINQATARTAYIFNGNGFGAARTVAGANFVNGFFDPINRTLNGHKYFVTTNLNAGGGATKDAALFGAFDHLHIGQFGGIDIVYDPYTLGNRGIGRLIVTTLMDGKADNAASVFRKTIQA